MIQPVIASKYIKKIFIRAASADPSPPLGTVLGNLGVQTTIFCNSFNLFTKSLPVYLLLKVTISIYDNKSTTFTIELPSTGYFLSLLKFEKIIKIQVFDRYQDKNISCIKV
jgi:ribosomal protein L11